MNGANVCDRQILVDHVKQYKIPKEYMFLSSDSEKSEGESDNHLSESALARKRSEKAAIKLEKKLYKPTGPDGRSWGDFRELTTEEGIILEELDKMAQRDRLRKETIEHA